MDIVEQPLVVQTTLWMGWSESGLVLSIPTPGSVRLAHYIPGSVRLAHYIPDGDSRFGERLCWVKDMAPGDVVPFLENWDRDVKPGWPSPAGRYFERAASIGWTRESIASELVRLAGEPAQRAALERADACLRAARLALVVAMSAAAAAHREWDGSDWIGPIPSVLDDRPAWSDQYLPMPTSPAWGGYRAVLTPTGDLRADTTPTALRHAADGWYVARDGRARTRRGVMIAVDALRAGAPTPAGVTLDEAAMAMAILADSSWPRWASSADAVAWSDAPPPDPLGW